MKNISKEDYLGAIYKHRSEDGGIKPTILAASMDVSSAAVTDMLKKLSRDGLVVYQRYKSIRLTAAGEEYAKKMVRRHRIWEIFLNQVVGLPWDKVHQEAERLEHSSSDELINRMEELLKFPEFDPHGDPIPDRNGVLPATEWSVPLSSAHPGTAVKVLRVNDGDSTFLAYMTEIGIDLGTTITVQYRREFDASLRILVGGREFDISGTAAGNIFVKGN